MGEYCTNQHFQVKVLKVVAPGMSVHQDGPWRRRNHWCEVTTKSRAVASKLILRRLLASTRRVIRFGTIRDVDPLSNHELLLHASVGPTGGHRRASDPSAPAWLALALVNARRRRKWAGYIG